MRCSWVRSPSHAAALAATILVTFTVVLGRPVWAGGGLAPFTEEAAARGIVYVPSQGEWGGYGVAAVDLDDDGDPDMVTLGDDGGVIGLFENDGNGFFTDRSATSGISSVTGGSAVVAADYDRDGDLDLFISRRIFSTDVLLRNDGGFQFTNVSAAAGVDDDTTHAAGCAWGDFDGDGWLDLYVSNLNGGNRLYHNLGDGTFVDVADAMGVALSEDPTLQAIFFDLEGDGDADLYVGNDKGVGCAVYRNHMFENVGGAFVEITDESGTEACVGDMGIALGDFDRDGHQDLYCTNEPPGNVLLLGQGNNTFVHGETAAAVESFATGWGPVFFDVDNDGYLELYVCNSDAANRLYRHEGSWPCADIAAAMGVDLTGPSFAIAVADVDDDGDLDMLASDHMEPIRLFINHEGQTRQWVKLDIVGEGAARWAVGATIAARTGATWHLREVLAGSNYKSQNELVQQIGLGQATVVDELVVSWPGGDSRTLYALDANQTWTIYPWGKLGDADLDGDRDLADFSGFAACHGLPVTPGCEMMDFDGSGVVDDDDFDAFLAAFDGPAPDCNYNGTPDMQEILAAPRLDGDGDGALDVCDCVPDFDDDGVIGVADLLDMLAVWGGSGPPDLDGDGTVAIADLLLLLGWWGPCG